MTEQEIFECATNLYITVQTYPEQATANICKVKEDLEGRGLWERFKDRLFNDEFRADMREEAELRMEANGQ
jgi:hypothetical protein